MMKMPEDIKVLLIDDDEDDYFITQEALQESIYARYKLHWVQRFEEGALHIATEAYDVYLVDLHLGQHSGFELLDLAVKQNCTKPLILFTGQGEREIDLQALELGATDFLVKGRFDGALLERSILYALRHKQTLNDLQLSKTRFNEVLDSQPELICRFNSDLVLTFVNRSCYRFFQLDAADMIGQSWPSLVPAEQREMILASIANVRASKQPFGYEYQTRSQRGTFRWQQWIDQPVLNDEGEIVEYQSVGIDITERKEAEIALRNALKHERELGELKSRFVSMASHEFRTPLTIIMSTASFLEMADAKISSEKRVSRLKKIQNTTRDMTDLLDEVLLFGKAEANRLEFEPVLISLYAFVNEIVEDIQAGIGEFHEICFQHQASDLIIRADEKLFRQILMNLLSNAIKYSPEGSIVTFRLEHDEKFAYFSVQDQGIGIPEADQERLFEPFHRARNARNISGTGLGLAITKKAVDLHGGAIEFKSGLEQGTCFKVSLPLLQS